MLATTAAIISIPAAAVISQTWPKVCVLDFAIKNLEVNFWLPHLVMSYLSEAKKQLCKMRNSLTSLT